MKTEGKYLEEKVAALNIELTPPDLEEMHVATGLCLPPLSADNPRLISLLNYARRSKIQTRSVHEQLREKFCGLPGRNPQKKLACWFRKEQTFFK